MSAVYDNWVRLVGATLRREQLRRRALRSFSDLSLASSSSFNSRASSRGLSSFNLSEGEAFDNEEIPHAPNYWKIFTFAELKSATRNFSADRMLDERGLLFKGWIDEKTYAPSRPGVGIAVTIKLPNPKSYSYFSFEDLKARQAEIEFLGKFCHPNVVKLLGYCLEDNKFLLVYEYTNNGSLENRLFRRWGKTLSWEIRMNIAIGAARALAFLHTTEGQVIHRDINAANIWLDGDYNAKLWNFSFVKLDNILDEFYSGVEKHPNFFWAKLGGYVAPDCAHIATGEMHLNNDVYILGVVLLEIVFGRSVLDRNLPTGEHNLVDWARPLLSDKRRSKIIIDPRLERQYPSKAVLQVA